jgi:hypothetical protein
MKKKRTPAWNVSVSVGENAHRELPRLASEFFSLGREASGPDSTPVQLHAFRLAAKRLRYTLELFLPMYGPALERRLEQVRKIQGMLGDRQDRAVLSARLRKRDAGSGAYRALLDKLEAEGRALEGKFRRYWRETFDAPGAETRWLRYLGRRPAATAAASPASAVDAMHKLAAGFTAARRRPPTRRD